MTGLRLSTFMLVACSVTSAIATEGQVLTLKELPRRSASPARAGTNAVSRLYISSTATDWFSARKACQDSGLRLVTIKDETKESDVIFGIIESGSYADTWIGLSDIRTDGQWVWEDSSALVFRNWGHPSQEAKNPVKNCVTIQTGDFKWYSYACRPGQAGYVAMRFICETID